MGRLRAKIATTILAIMLTAVGCGGKPDVRVWLIGVDGADWSVIDPLIEKGQAPSFATLKSEGSWGELHSLDPMLSPIIWTSVITGKSPEKHGITWFMVRNRKTGESIPVTSSMRRSRALWNILSDNGLTVSVTGWWASWPAETVNGWIVSDHTAYHGFGLSGADKAAGIGLTHPPSLAEKIRPLLVKPFDATRAQVQGLFPITDAEFDTIESGTFDFANPLHHTLFALATFKRYRAVANLLEKKNAAFNCVYFEFVDTMSHIYMKYRPPRMDGLDPALFDKYRHTVDNVYRLQDRTIADWVARRGDNEIVIVLSDHGFKTGADRPAEVGATTVQRAHLWHRDPGIVAFIGKGIRPGAKIENASVLDIAPTILAVFGLPVPRDFDGRVLEEIFTDDFAASLKMKTIQTYEKPGDEEKAPVSSPVDPEIEARLRALGYIGDVGSAEVEMNRAEAYRKKGETDKAIRALDGVREDSSLKIDALLRAGDIALEQRQIDRAYASYKEALVQCRRRRCAPAKIGEVYFKLGAYYRFTGRSEEAVSALERCLEINPGYRPALDLLEEISDSGETR